MKLKPISVWMVIAIFAMGTLSPVLWSQEEKKKKKKPHPAKTWAVKVNPNHYQIHSRIEFSGDLPPKPYDRIWLKYMVDYSVAKWNHNARCRVGKGKNRRWVRLSFRVKWKTRSRRAKPTPGYHQIAFVSLAKDYLRQINGQKPILKDGYRSWMWIGGRRRGLSGAYSMPMTPTTMAHEFGHLWGTRDEYPREKNAVKRFLKTWLNPPKEWPPSLMYFSWLPLAQGKERHYRKIYRYMHRKRWLKKKP